MKSFKIPTFLSSLFGFCLLPGLDAPPANADFAFGTPVNLRTVILVIDPAHDAISSFSYDGLEMYIISGSGHDNDLRVLRRASKDEDWGPPKDIGPSVNTPSPYDDSGPSISADGLTLYFHSNRPGGYGSYDLYVTTRAGTHEAWGPPVNVGPKVNSSYGDVGPWISPDGLELYFYSWRPGGYGNSDIWVTRRATTNEPWEQPVNVGPVVNSADYESWPCLSPDGLVLFFCPDNRAGGYDPWDMWMTRRTNLSAPWQSPVNLGPKVNSSLEDLPRISSDGRTFYYRTVPTQDPATWDYWQAPIIPVVDFNGDKKVDLKDFSILAQYWGQNESSVDMGPTPLGDGTVDIQDVVVLAANWLKEFGLIARWKLDETEGAIAHDSVGDKNGILNGNPVWQPAGGKVNGSLEFDEIDDYVSTPFILDPAVGSFSVFAWVKGGAPGQVIISQIGGVNWLAAGTSQGKLMTELKAAGRFGTPLFSEAVITDGQWHRVGMTWDGSTRTLFVDGVEAAKGTQASLAGSTGGLYIGAGKNLEPGSFWTGLIDDVRIHSTALRACPEFVEGTGSTTGQ